jgi:hypothetical protein
VTVERVEHIPPERSGMFRYVAGRLVDYRVVTY